MDPTLPTPPALDWHLSETSLAALCQLHSLVQLEVGCDTDLACLTCLSPLTALRRLALRRLPRAAAGAVSALGRCEALASLSLADGGLGDESMEAVGRIAGLTCLGIQVGPGDLLDAVTCMLECN
jgi:hypothetical protein